MEDWTRVDGQAFIKHLREKWKGRACPMCGIGSWNITDSVQMLPAFTEDAVIMGKPLPVVPVVAVVCNNCGNTILVNAIVSGQVKPDPGQAVSTQKSETRK